MDKETYRASKRGARIKQTRPPIAHQALNGIQNLGGVMDKRCKTYVDLTVQRLGSPVRAPINPFANFSVNRIESLLK